MDKRYQIFVSSTFTDLKEERSHVIQALMEMDCIPAGMELFPACDEEQFEFIKKVIDDCDYYLLIIGGRYGSIADDGLSYTEKEFDYAIEKGLKVIALVHSNPEELPAKNSEKSPESQKRLNLFKEKVMTNRLVKQWENPNELAGLVALSLQKTIKMYPATGWVRGNESTDKLALLEQINSLQNEKNIFRERVIELENLVTEKEKFTIENYLVEIVIEQKSNKINVNVEWNEILISIGSLLLQSQYMSEKKISINTASMIIEEREIPKISGTHLSFETFRDIKIQLLALEYIELTLRESDNRLLPNILMWSLTKKAIKEITQSLMLKEN